MNVKAMIEHIETSQTHYYFIKLEQRKSPLRRRFGYLVFISLDFDDFTSVYLLGFVLIEKIYQTLESMFLGVWI